ncbi:hypothetical protein D3C72_1699430 [compost metagenome]
MSLVFSWLFQGGPVWRRAIGRKVARAALPELDPGSIISPAHPQLPGLNGKKSRRPDAPSAGQRQVRTTHPRHPACRAPGLLRSRLPGGHHDRDRAAAGRVGSNGVHLLWRQARTLRAGDQRLVRRNHRQGRRQPAARARRAGPASLPGAHASAPPAGRGPRPVRVHPVRRTRAQR